MSRLRTLRKDGVTHVARESRSGYVLLCRSDGVPGEIGVFGWSEELAFTLSPGACARCIEALSPDAGRPRLRLVDGGP